jgi:hypothetical protein
MRPATIQNLNDDIERDSAIGPTPMFLAIQYLHSNGLIKMMQLIVDMRNIFINI